MKGTGFAILTIFFCGLTFGGRSNYGLAADEPVPLPVRKVVLYKNGIGYFEHLGMIGGGQQVEIVLPSSQLNDVLKSLTVIDLGNGEVSGVTYDSTAPLDRRLAELPIDLAAVEGLAGFLNQIRGAGVEIRAPGGAVIGKLMSAEIRTRSTGPGATVQFVQVSLFTPAGEVRVFDVDSAGSLRLTDPALASDVGRYLDLLDSSNQRDVRTLRIQTVGSGERQLYVSYTSEAPIWKTTYRIVLDSKRKPLLQGWAIVDNTTPMDWLNVNLSLVAGAPVSFVQNLSQPLYARRPVIPLPQGVQVTPQVHEGTLQQPPVAAPPPPAAPEESRLDDARAARVGVTGRLEMLAAAPAAQPPPAVAGAALGDVMRQRAPETAQARALGEQFEYSLRHAVHIRRNESALLPILHTEVEGEKISLYRESAERNPRLALWLKNVSGMTLDGGSFTVIDSNAFAGEGLTGTIQPGENRLLSYALDLGVEVSSRSDLERQRVERVQLSRGVLRMHSKLVDQRTYLIRNNDEKDRIVVVEHPVRTGWKLVDSPEPAESSASYYRFRTGAKTKSTSTLTVREESPQETTYAVTNITPEQIALWVRERSIDSEAEKALSNISAKKDELQELSTKISNLEKEQNEIFRDQERVRGNVQRLAQSPEEAALRQRYIRQLDQQENRLAALRSEREKLETERLTAQKELDGMIQGLSFDRRL